VTRALLPRHLEIERHLRELIASASPGDPLPSDAELCARFGVSRMTARHAVQTLAAEGLLYRRRGHGTFVAVKPFHRRMGTLLSFTEEMRLRGLRASSRVLEAGRAAARPDEAAALELAPRDPIILVYRVRMADGVPVALERVALPPECAAVLERDLETGSLHAALEAVGRVPTIARGSVTARLSTAEEQELLMLPSRSALLIEQRTITDQDGAPVERTETRYSSDRYVFDVELHRVGEVVEGALGDQVPSAPTG
jgi:GntR family transcriptional regulator